jgi:Ser/Thr protein kinase RdoA (MazF antagonist)
MIPTTVLRAARTGFGLPRGSVRVLSTRFGKLCVAHHARGHAPVQIRLVRDAPGLTDSLNAETRWLHHLAHEHRLRVPAPFAWRDGGFVSPALCGQDHTVWRAIVCRWMPGAHVSRGLSPAECRKVGALLAQMHNANGNTPPGIIAARTTWGIPRLFELASALRDLMMGTMPAPDRLTEAFVARLRDAHLALESAWAALPTDSAHVGLIHTDAHWQNVRWYRGKPGLLDFEDFAIGRFLLDIACFYARFEPHDADQTVLHELLHGYTGVRALPHDALRELQVMLAFRRFDYAGWVLSWPRITLRAWGPDALFGTPAYMERALARA